MDTTTCTAGRHGSLRAYRQHGCRCPDMIQRMHDLWQQQDGRKRQRRAEAAAARSRTLKDRRTVTERAEAIAVLTARGLPGREIAERLDISTRTVDRYRATPPQPLPHNPPRLRIVGARPVCNPTTADNWVTPDARASDEQVDIALQAIEACRRCPLLKTCGTDLAPNERLSVILAGVPYDAKGRPMPRCQHCGGWCLGRKPDSLYCSDLCSNRAKHARAKDRGLTVAA